MTLVSSSNRCHRCGGNGYLMRVHDKAMVKCDGCEGTGREGSGAGSPAGQVERERTFPSESARQARRIVE